MLDIDRMRRIAEGLYVREVLESFGESGADGLRSLLDFLVQLYGRIDPANRSSALYVVRQLQAEPLISKLPVQVIPRVSSISDQVDGPCCVSLQPNGSIHVFDISGLDFDALSESAIVYKFQSNQEHFVIARRTYSVINPSPTHASVFSRPTFSNLSSALEDYKQRVARTTSCLILKEAWRDDRRIFFHAKPEATMRKSLNQFLSHVLQDAEVRPEQNVDETHPVDVKVTWMYSNQRAIVEIKWLGDSMSSDGKIATSYRDARALSGAQQLAEYLEQSASWGPSVSTRGYLVVFDGRRRGLTESTTQVSYEDGFYYKDREVSYNPDYSKVRADFEAPARMFMHPVVLGDSA